MPKKKMQILKEDVRFIINKALEDHDIKLGALVDYIQHKCCYHIMINIPESYMLCKTCNKVVFL